MNTLVIRLNVFFWVGRIESVGYFWKTAVDEMFRIYRPVESASKPTENV